jgi:hypothetical protein
MNIEDVLHRRSDLSTFVVHLSRDSGGVSAADHLEAIIRDQTLRAGSPQGWAQFPTSQIELAGESQRAVCLARPPWSTSIRCSLPSPAGGWT